jgi:hypothetical protein
LCAALQQNRYLIEKIGSPDWIRTSYLVLRRHALYPNELRDHFLTAFSPLRPGCFSGGKRSIQAELRAH